MKKILLVMLLLSFFAAGMGRKPATETAVPVKENKAAEANSTQAAPDFKLKDINGKEVALKDYKNKKTVLLVFWATWCVYCRQEIPEVIKLKEQYKGKDLEILGINIQEPAQTVKAFAEKTGINYNILLDIQGEAARSFEVQGIPMNVLIDKKGNIIYGGSFGKEVKELISRNVK